MSRSRDLANLGDEATGGLVKADIGLGNVDNTSDANKPVSTAQQTALDAKLAVTTASSTYLTQSNASSTYAPLASPDFTGTVDLTGTTLSLDNDQISGDKISGGTIGAGTFDGTLGSNATFPTGHIVSSSFATAPNTSDFSTTSNSYNEVSSNLRVTITPTSPNKVLLMVNGGNPRMPSGFSMFCSWGIVNSSGSLTTANLANDEGLENIRGGMNSTDTDAHSGGHSFSFLHTPSSYGSPIIYTPVMKSQNSGSIVFFTEGASNVQYVMSMAFEIKQ